MMSSVVDKRVSAQSSRKAQFSLIANQGFILGQKLFID